MGTTFAILHASGTVPISIDLFISILMGFISACLLLLINSGLMLSCPVLFLGLRDFIRLSISSGSVGDR